MNLPGVLSIGTFAGNEHVDFIHALLLQNSPDFGHIGVGDACLFQLIQISDERFSVGGFFVGLVFEGAVNGLGFQVLALKKQRQYQVGIDPLYVGLIPSP